MRKLAHGYTNETVGDGRVVVKTYRGPDATHRRARELTILSRLAGDVPVPPLLGSKNRTLRLGFVDGTHGQELERAPVGAPVKRAGRRCRNGKAAEGGVD